MKRASLMGEGALIVLRNVGLLLLYISPLPLGLLPVAMFYGETNAFLSVVLMALTFAASGFALSRLPTSREPRLREGLLIAAVGWFAVPLGSVVLFTQLEGWTIVDALFETMSAWTGTGFTISDVTVLHKTTLFWRSLMQWIGGLGVIVLTLAILARPGTGAHTLYVSEAREDKLRPSVLSTVRTIWRIYIILTIAGIGLLFLAGFPIWEALNHGMTGIATGGMSTKPNNIGSFQKPIEQLALIPIMIVGSFPFVALYAALRGRWRGFLRDEQVKAFAFVMLFAFPILLYGLVKSATPASPTGLVVDALFQVTSAATSTGFQTADLSRWAPAAMMGLMGLMLLGGAAGSTAGGIKLFRGVLLVKGALWKLRRSGLPHFAVTTFKFGEERLDEHEANEEFAEASFILVLSFALLFGGAIVLMTILPSVSPFHILFDVASTQANNGINLGIASATLPDSAKAAFTVIMWAGRLEILPVLLLLRGLIPRLDKG